MRAFSSLRCQSSRGDVLQTDRASEEKEEKRWSHYEATACDYYSCSDCSSVCVCVCTRACFIVYSVRLLSSTRGSLLQPDLLLCFPLCFPFTTLILHACKSHTCSRLCLFYTHTCVQQPPPKNPKQKQTSVKKTKQTKNNEKHTNRAVSSI